MNLGKLRKIIKDREAWSAAVCGVTKGRTRLSDQTITRKGNRLSELGDSQTLLRYFKYNCLHTIMFRHLQIPYVCVCACVLTQKEALTPHVTLTLGLIILLRPGICSRLILLKSRQPSLGFRHKGLRYLENVMIKLKDIISH